MKPLPANSLINRMVVLLILFTLPIISKGQVDAIKGGSASHGSRNGGSGSDRSGNSSSFGAAVAEGFFRAVIITPFVLWQEQKLSKAEEVPSLRSAELFLQGAGQSSSYIFTPRIRANYGLFSTDFRVNYLIEKDFDGIKTLHTYDWQVLQLNIITTKDVNWRMGAGFLTEAFGDKATYGEWSTAITVHPSRSRWGGIGEYRGAESRKEVSLVCEYAAYNKSLLHISFTGGMIFQRYYGSVDVWGMQFGTVMRLY